jgi:hypothetical protein
VAAVSSHPLAVAERCAALVWKRRIETGRGPLWIVGTAIGVAQGTTAAFWQRSSVAWGGW